MFFTVLLPVLLQANGENEKLIKAATDGDLTALVSALGTGTDATAKDTAFIMGVEGRHVEIAETLLDAGADVHAGEDAAIDRAIENDHDEMVRLLLRTMHARDSIQDLTTASRAKPSLCVDALLLAHK